MHKQPAVYMLTNQRNGTLYIGVTSNLVQRIWQHRQRAVEGFSARYGLHWLVYSAITREKQLKKWKRAWKIRLIEVQNPGWRDLWEEII
ncbi:GIY-YIG nuclease family protein [Oceanimonas baumannii]|uniref:GIY-YIG nuclease family protein n=1 Tax=Oceanimonas baumannii TaxID=129578 RepID=UPI003A9263B2